MFELVEPILKYKPSFNNIYCIHDNKYIDYTVIKNIPTYDILTYTILVNNHTY